MAGTTRWTGAGSVSLLGLWGWTRSWSVSRVPFHCAAWRPFGSTTTRSQSSKSSPKMGSGTVEAASMARSTPE